MVKQKYRLLTSVSVLIVITCLLNACVNTPKFNMQAEQPSAWIDVSSLDSPEINIQQQWYTLVKNAKGMARIPAGHRILLANNYIATMVNYSGVNNYNACHAKVSFIPLAHRRYFASFALRKTSCVLNVFRQSKRDGKLSIEPTKK